MSFYSQSAPWRATAAFSPPPNLGKLWGINKPISGAGIAPTFSAPTPNTGMSPEEEEVYKRWAGTKAFNYATQGPRAFQGSTKWDPMAGIKDMNKYGDQMQEFAREMATAKRLGQINFQNQYDPRGPYAHRNLEQQIQQNIDARNTAPAAPTAPTRPTAPAPAAAPMGKTRSDIERINGARSSNELRSASAGLASLRRVSGSMASSQPSAPAPASSAAPSSNSTSSMVRPDGTPYRVGGLVDQTGTQDQESPPVRPDGSTPRYGGIKPTREQAAAQAAQQAPVDNPLAAAAGAGDERRMTTKPGTYRPGASESNRDNKTTTSFKDSNPYRGGKSNPYRDGKSNPYRDGKSNPYRKQ